MEEIKMKTKKIVLTAVSLLAATGIILAFTAGTNNGSQGVDVRTIALEKDTLTQAVSATGMVYSSQSTEVYSSLSYPVGTVHVAVGDRVDEGDVLAELDTSALESDIAQKKAATSVSQATANQNLATAQKDLETYKYNTENGYDSSLLSAESSVTTAELDVQTAELEVQAASQDLSAARRNLRDARNGEGDYEEAEATDSQISALRDTVVQKETALEKAQTNLERVGASLEKAKSSLESTKVTTGDSLSTYEDKVKNAQLGTNFNDQWISIQKLEADLEKGAIIAPVSGTITQVKAVEGGSGNGLLFVIQETESLKVIANIKEYDIASVSIGDKVTIKADATGEQVFEGTLSKIAPTSTLTAGGATQTSTDSEYESEIAVASTQTGLRVGMNTRLSIITQEKKNVYAVPYEAVGTNEAGEPVVYIAAEQEDGSYIAEAVMVDTGLETDLYVEISSDSFTDGMLVIKNIEGIEPGAKVRPGADQGTTNRSGRNDS